MSKAMPACFTPARRACLSARRCVRWLGVSSRLA